MKQQYRVLVLTDHRGHSAENSIYALLRAMKQSEHCASVDIASRGLAVNDAFFYHKEANQLFVSQVSEIFTFDASGAAFLYQLRRASTTDYDLVFLRLPRPLSDDFLAWLPSVFPSQAMVNHPNGILTTSTKAFLLNFPELCPPMKLCYTLEDVWTQATQRSIVLKPLKEYGGRGLLKIAKEQVDDGDQSYPLSEYRVELAARLEEGPLLAMSFLKNVSQGDKRIIVVDGEIMAASLRLPPAGGWLCNVSRGGVSVATEVTPEEEHIIRTISPRLREEGVLVFGADTLTNDQGKRVLSEINTLSIGGFPQAEAQSGRPIIPLTIDKIFKYADAYFAG